MNLVISRYWFNAMCMPCYRYTVTWMQMGTIDRKDRGEIQTFKMWILKKMERIKWIDRMGNDGVLIKIMETNLYQPVCT